MKWKRNTGFGRIEDRRGQSGGGSLGGTLGGGGGGAALLRSFSTVLRVAEGAGAHREAEVALRDGSTVHLAYCTNVHPAEDLRVAAILCPTNSGATPRRVASFR